MALYGPLEDDFLQAVAQRNDGVTLNGDSGWITILQVSFTTTVTGPIFCQANFVHGYESGQVNGIGRFTLSNGTNGYEIQVIKMGYGSNASFGAHSMSDVFANVPAGSYTVYLQLRNFTAGTQLQTNWGDPNNIAQDILQVRFKG